LEAPASEEQVTAPVDVATEHVAAPPAPVEIARVEPQDPCDLELSTLQRAQQLLSTDPLRAVHELDAIEHTCPAGPLAQERLATRALALCQGGDRSGGRVAAETLAARYPSSPSRARVDQVCGLPSP
jgi:hypothetical protein